MCFCDDAVCMCCTQDGVTALFRAANNGRSDCLQLLLENGADTKVKDNVRDTFLQVKRACELCLSLRTDLNIDLSVHLSRPATHASMPSQAGYTALIRAALKGHIDCVRLLVEAGADKDTFDAVRHT